MQLAISSTKHALRPKPRTSDHAKITCSTYAITEINAYIAIRDNLLAEAEETANGVTLKRASLANDLVESCLKPARTPYEAQHLPEAAAVRERKRCVEVKARIAQMQARMR